MALKKLHLFEAFGIELEYMIVQKGSLNIFPMADELLKHFTGSYTADYEKGLVAWSNELVNHVIELKSNGPTSDLVGLLGAFLEDLLEIQTFLSTRDAALLPTGAHPWMDPYSETVIWPHEYNEVYSLYNRIFDCRGHGWANLQSTHLNLSFGSDEEFGRLHAALRVLLPILPVLSASSPVLDGKITGFIDSRLETYRHNQEKIPIIIGDVIPEGVFSEAEYYTRIFNPIREAIAPYDTEGILSHHFLNSRGAIARFDRGAIEIRILDIQETPRGDFAILQMIIDLLKKLTQEEMAGLEVQKKWDTLALKSLWLDCIRFGSQTVLRDREYLNFWGLRKSSCTARELWEHLFEGLPPRDLTGEFQKIYLDQGNLSERILKVLNQGKSLKEIYGSISSCLLEDRFFRA